MVLPRCCRAAAAGQPRGPHPVDVEVEAQPPAQQLPRGLGAVADALQEAAEAQVVLLRALQHLPHHVLQQEQPRLRRGLGAPPEPQPRAPPP